MTDEELIEAVAAEVSCHLWATIAVWNNDDCGDFPEMLAYVQEIYRKAARAVIPVAQAPLLARIAELEADNARLRQDWADLHNQVNIVDSPYDRAIKAVDAMMLDIRNRARNALRSTQ